MAKAQETTEYTQSLLAQLDKTRKVSDYMLGSSPHLLSLVHYWIPTGCYPLDALISRGIPGGRLVEVFGPEASGKSMLALSILAQVQRIGGVGVLLDPETTTTMDLVQMAGVDPNSLIVGYPRTVEATHEFVMEFLDVKAKMDQDAGTIIPAVLVWDSLAATPSEEELGKAESGHFGDRTVAAHARAVNNLLKVLPPKLNDAGVTTIVINQIRTRIGVMFGDKYTTTGGMGLPFYASLRIKLDLRKPLREKLDTGVTEEVGVEIKAQIVKNKVGRPYGVCKFPIFFNSGIDNPTACLWYLKDTRIVETRGAWSYLEGPEGEIRFQSAGWNDIFYQHEDYIYQTVMGQMVPRESEGVEEESEEEG